MTADVEPGAEGAVPGSEPAPAPPSAPRRRGRFDQALAVSVLRKAVWLLLLAGVLSFVVLGADNPPDPLLRQTRTPVAEFGEISFRVKPSSARGRSKRGPQRCALLAETPAQQQQGLMGRTDLAGYDAMLFRFQGEMSLPFYMFNTQLPLSIAWFDSAGRFVSSADMEPCLDRPATECPKYYAARPYRYALEVPQGGLPGLGIGPGAQLTLGGGCS